MRSRIPWPGARPTVSTQLPHGGLARIPHEDKIMIIPRDQARMVDHAIRDQARVVDRCSMPPCIKQPCVVRPSKHVMPNTCRASGSLITIRFRASITNVACLDNQIEPCGYRPLPRNGYGPLPLNGYEPLPRNRYGPLPRNRCRMTHDQPAMTGRTGGSSEASSGTLCSVGLTGRWAPLQTLCETLNRFEATMT